MMIGGKTIKDSESKREGVRIEGALGLKGRRFNLPPAGNQAEGRRHALEKK